MPLILSRNDITKVKADAVVLPANEDLLPGRGVSLDIFTAAGKKELEQACRWIGHCAIGDAVITDAFNLDAKVIIHAVGPVWRGGGHHEAKLLYSAYQKSLQLAADSGCISIAFPLLSSGNYGYPKAYALNIANRAITDFLSHNDMDVHLIFYDNESVVIGRRLFEEIDEYIDDKYVGEKRAQAYRDRTKNESKSSIVECENTVPLSVSLMVSNDDHIDNIEWDLEGDEWDIVVDSEQTTGDGVKQLEDWVFQKSTVEEDLKYSTTFLDEANVAEIRERSEDPWIGPPDAGYSEGSLLSTTEDVFEGGRSYTISPMSTGKTGMSKGEKTSLKERLKGLIKGDSETFHQMLFRLIDESGLSYPQVYNRANMSKKLFSKIKLNPDSTPKKKNIVALAVALRLDMKQTTELLMKAGYALSNSSMTDVIISYFIEKQNYDVFEINEVLFEYGLENDLLGF